MRRSVLRWQRRLFSAARNNWMDTSGTRNLFDLRIHHYRFERVALPPDETFSTLFDKSLNGIQQVKEHVLASRNHQLLNVVSEIESHVRNMLQIATRKQTLAEHLEQGSMLQSFYFEARGILLSLLHLINETLNQLESNKMGNNGNLQGKYEATSLILSLASTLFQNHAQFLGNSPFHDDIDLTTGNQVYQLRFTPFLEKIGTQYSSGYRSFVGLIISTVAAHGYAHTFQHRISNEWLYLAGFGMLQAYYTMRFSEAASSTARFYKEISVEKGKNLWGLADRQIVKMISQFALPHVHVSSVFNIPSFDRREAANRLLTSISNWNQFVDPNALPLDSDGAISLQEFLRNLSLIPGMLLEQPKHDSIQLRFIAQHSPHPSLSSVSDFPKLHRLFTFMNRGGSGPARTSGGNQQDGTIIVHLHGGGFVAMSPSSHETYLRKWVLDTGIPIVSVDYKKAPEFKFPVIPEECYWAYRWTVENAEKLLPNGQELKNIILIGDSAGGNLAMGVAIRAIVDGFRVPDALVLTYPASTISLVPSMSRLLSLSEPLVHLKLLEMLFQAYLPESVKNYATRDGIVSPGLAPAEVLRHFPPTYLNVGSLDPIFDDTILAAKQIAKYNGNRVCLEVYDGLSHGYLNLAFPFFKDCVRPVDNISRWINKFVARNISDSAVR